MQGQPRGPPRPRGTLSGHALGPLTFPPRPRGPPSCQGFGPPRAPISPRLPTQPHFSRPPPPPPPPQPSPSIRQFPTPITEKLTALSPPVKLPPIEIAEDRD